MIGRCRLGTYIYRSLRQWLLLSSLSFLLQSTVTKLRCSFLGMWSDHPPCDCLVERQYDAWKKMSLARDVPIRVTLI
jgi:hypothetical protein